MVGKKKKMEWKVILALIVVIMLLALSFFGMILGLIAMVQASRKTKPYLQWYIHLILVIIFPPLEFFLAIKEFRASSS
jgi:cytochrome c biogenesis protein CcdA